MTCDAESARWSPPRRRWEQRLKRDFDGVWWWAQIRKRTIIYGKRKVQIWICSLRGWQVTWKLQVWSLWSTHPEHACLITCYTGLWMNLYIYIYIVLNFFFNWKFVILVWFCFIGHINQQNKSGGVHEPEGSLRAKPWSIFLFNQPPNEGLNYILQQWYLNLSKECIMFKKLCWIWNHFATSCFCSTGLPSTAPTPNKDS